MWDKIPEEMELYLSRNGKHFNKRLSDFAVAKMRKDGNTKITSYTKEEVEDMLKAVGKSLDNYNAPYDAVYLANMAKADFADNCMPSKDQQALFVDAVMADADGYEGMVLNRWLADMAGKGIWIDWERMI